jgi:hypothetical protein
MVVLSAGNGSVQNKKRNDNLHKEITRPVSAGSRYWFDDR